MKHYGFMFGAVLGAILCICSCNAISDPKETEYNETAGISTEIPAVSDEEENTIYDSDESCQSPYMVDLGNEMIFFNSFMRPELFYYYDKETDISGPLCGRPECTHEDSSCNAWTNMGGFPTSFVYSEDQTCLRWISIDPKDRILSLYRKEADGTKTIRELKISDPGNNYQDFPGGSNKTYVIRNKLLACGYRQEVKDGEWYFSDVIQEYDLTDGSSRTVYESAPSAAPASLASAVKGPWVYYSLSQEKGQNPEDEEGFIELNRYQVETGKTECLFHIAYDPDLATGAWFDLLCTDEGVYWVSESEGGKFMLNCYDMQSGRIVTCFSANDGPYVHWLAEDRVITYLTPENQNIHLIIRDFSGNLVSDRYYPFSYQEESGFPASLYLGYDKENCYIGLEDYVSGISSTYAIPLDNSEGFLLWDWEGE